VHDALGVRCVQRIGDREREQFLDGQRPTGDLLLQRHAIQELHRDEDVSLMLTDVVDGAHIGWLRAEAASASRWKRARACASLATASGNRLTATKRRRRVSSAL
jgi:hypothetical protein